MGRSRERQWRFLELKGLNGLRLFISVMQVSAIPEVSRVGALSGNAHAIGHASVTFCKIMIKTFVRNENRSKNPNKVM